MAIYFTKFTKEQEEEIIHINFSHRCYGRCLIKNDQETIKETEEKEMKKLKRKKQKE